MVLLQIAQLGNAVLRKKAKQLKFPLTQKNKEQILDMQATLHDSTGVGIAAPQVYLSQQICIIASAPSIIYPKAPVIKPFVIINPKIIVYSKEEEKGWEGCLSVPGIRAIVPRAKKITAEYYTPQGKKVKKAFTGFLARIFQHEYDHLQGVVFLDRITSTKDIIAESEFKKILAKKK